MIVSQSIVFGLLAATVASAAPASDVICHTSNPDDCYPRLFVATHDFQVVHEDQSLPPGLHVRINLETHKKEAKINVPGSEDPSSVAIVVKDGNSPVEEHHHDVASPVIDRAPVHDPVGKVKEQQPKSEPFLAQLAVLRDGFLPSDQSLDLLEELAHDIYYGIKLAEDPDALKTLFCLIVSPTTSLLNSHRAASILAGALSNNGAAQDKVAEAWPTLKATECSSTNTPLGQALVASLSPTPKKTVGLVRELASLAKAKVSVLNGLIKNDEIRHEFLQQGIMGRLLEIMALDGKEWAGAQRRTGELVLDNFLDQDMGAKLGEWPRVPRLSDHQCRSEDDLSASEGCWDYHVDRIMRANKAARGHWSTVLHQKLAAARGVQGSHDDERHEL
ncbi:hypothetical protein CP533_4691 [Ophiocordyceps camponoti-saundersi (nom. inval.)]|nr:hypothetical protein CP533_4691 [Ophiocordyceps camponoti-saundersi (nom. inval.)]